MGAPERAKRTAVTPLTMGIVVSLTAMTAGIAPAAADPRSDPSGPTPTIVMPEPPVAAQPQQEAPKSPRSQEAPQEVPKAPEQPQVQKPQEVPAAPAPEPVVVPSPAAQPAPEAPEPAPVAPTAAPSSQAAPPSRTRAPQAPAVQAPVTDAPSSAPKPQPVEVAPSSPSVPSPTAPTPSATPAPSATPSAPTTPPPSEADEPAELRPAPSSGSASSSPPSAEAPAPEMPDADPSPTPATADEQSESTSTRSQAPVSPSVSEAARQIQTELPQTLAAPKDDVQVAMQAKVVEEEPLPAATKDVTEFADALGLPGRDRKDERSPSVELPSIEANRVSDLDRRPGRDWDRRVKQWDPDWVRYDEYYRPVLCNPYRQPVKIVYVYQNTPRIVIINPLARVVLNVAEYAAYSFTAVVANTINTAVNTAASVAVGSFFGGGYFPGYGLPLPPPPPPVLRYDNVPVQVRYPNAVYQPFRVQRIVDVGPDARYGGNKVLLDGVTPAWGEWTQSPTGERQFEIHKTQQFPGLEEPSPGPLPGDYQLRLASDAAAPGMDSKTVYMIVVAGLLAAMSLGAVAWSVLLGRRRGAH